MMFQRRKRYVPGINSSSSADIAFLLLVFFLVTTSIDSDKGIQRRLPPPIESGEIKQKTDIEKRNLLEIYINHENRIMVREEEIPLRDLKEIVKEFIANPKDLPDLPEKENIEVPFFGIFPITTKHIIALQNDVSTKYQAYINVQNELTAAYNELRNELAKQKFNKTFAELSDEGKKAILTIYPRRISEAEEIEYFSQSE